MKNNLLFEERLSSQRTAALFIGLTFLFFCLMIWRVFSDGLDILAIVFFCLFGFFLFCVANYRILIIRLTPTDLILKFGIFTWTVPIANIERCQLDEIPALLKYGGAGIHFMFVRNRYRVSYNFLEYPRVVISLRKRAGLVRDISFSTRQADDLLQLIQEAVLAQSKGL